LKGEGGRKGENIWSREGEKEMEEKVMNINRVKEQERILAWGSIEG